MCRYTIYLIFTIIYLINHTDQRWVCIFKYIKEKNIKYDQMIIKVKISKNLRVISAKYKINK